MKFENYLIRSFAVLCTTTVAACGGAGGGGQSSLLPTGTSNEAQTTASANGNEAAPIVEVEVEVIIEEDTVSIPEPITIIEDPAIEEGIAEDPVAEEDIAPPPDPNSENSTPVFVFKVIDADENDILTLEDGDILDLDELPPFFNFEAETETQFGSVQVSLESEEYNLTRVEEGAIWTVNDQNAGFDGSAGTYTISATGFSGDGASGLSSKTDTIQIILNSDQSDTPPPPTEDDETPADPSPEEPAQNGPIEQFQEHLINNAGNDSLNCGDVLVGEPSLNVNQCIVESFLSTTPSYAVYQRQIAGSTIADGITLNPVGLLEFWSYDSSAGGNGITSVVCENATYGGTVLEDVEDMFSCGVTSTTPPSVDGVRQGVFFTDAEVEIWRERSENGPFKSFGDVEPNSPGEWDRIVDHANTFMNDPSRDRTTRKSGQNGYENYETHQTLKDAAFCSLVKNDAEIAETVKTEILWQVRNSGITWNRQQYYDTDSDGWWDAEWVFRLAMAYDFTKHYFSDSEKADVENWFKDTAYQHANSVHAELALNFPGRLDRNYDEKRRSAQSFDGAGSPDGHAYLDENGNSVNRLPNLAKWYNNRRSTRMGFVSFVAILTDDATLKNHAKIYTEEYIKFGMFPDGTPGEYNRNGNYGYPSAGKHYNAINLQTIVFTAEAFARTGDMSLYELETREGLWTTVASSNEPMKSIKTGVVNYLDEIDYTVEHFCEDPDCLARYPQTHPNNRIDSYSEDRNIQWVNEVWFSPMGNKFWQDKRIQDGYMHRRPNSEGFPNSSRKTGTAGPSGNPYGGSGVVFPSTLFMFGLMEDKVDVYP